MLDVERFSVRDGEFVTIIGPSGCGKSTLLHIMGGFIKGESGEIRVHRHVNGPGPDRGVMFQEFALFPGRPWPEMWPGVWKPKAFPGTRSKKPFGPTWK